jgi:signal transduction histidine kinase
MAKHARATQATIRVTREDSSLTVVVHDDGIGGANPANGSGLTGLRDRLDVLGGSLDLTSPPGNGTTIAAHLPRHTG